MCFLVLILAMILCTVWIQMFLFFCFFVRECSLFARICFYYGFCFVESLWFRKSREKFSVFSIKYYVSNCCLWLWCFLLLCSGCRVQENIVCFVVMQMQTAFSRCGPLYHKDRNVHRGARCRQSILSLKSKVKGQVAARFKDLPTCNLTRS